MRQVFRDTNCTKHIRPLWEVMLFGTKNCNKKLQQQSRNSVISVINGINKYQESSTTCPMSHVPWCSMWISYDIFGQQAPGGSSDALVQAEPLDTAVVLARDLISTSCREYIQLSSTFFTIQLLISNYFHAAPLGPNKPNKPIGWAEYGWVPHIRRLSPSTHAKDKFTLPGHLSHASRRTGRMPNMSQRFGTGLSSAPRSKWRCSKVFQSAPDCTRLHHSTNLTNQKFNRIQQNSTEFKYSMICDFNRRLSKIIENYRRLSKI